MSKQIYIDENGNELLVSGTINTASILPVSGNDQTSVSDKLDDKLDKVDASGSGTLNWSGDEVLSGDLTVNGSNGITSTKLNGVTIGSSPKFTDTQVTQSLSSTNAHYPILFSYAGNADTTANVTNICYRNNSVYINPSTGNIRATQLNGVTIGSSPKFTDTIPVQVYAQANRNFTSSTTLSYTGLSTTCPAGQRMLVRAYFRYVNNAPLQVGAYTSSTGASAYSCMGYADANTGSFTLNFVITGGETVYYWAKYGGAGANRIDEEKILLG